MNKLLAVFLYVIQTYKTINNQYKKSNTCSVVICEDPKSGGWWPKVTLRNPDSLVVSGIETSGDAAGMLSSVSSTVLSSLLRIIYIPY